MHKSNWDDLKFVLAVAEHGSVNAAAKAIGVNHATVLRRVTAFEEAHGSPVFERSAQGYTVLPGKMGLIGAGRDAAVAINRVEQMSAHAQEGGLTRVQVTSTDSLCTYLLPRLFAAVEDCDIALEICSTNSHIDLGRLRAEITVRPAPQLPNDLEGIKAAELAISAFAPVQGNRTRWLGMTGSLGRVASADWMAEHGHDRDVGGAADSFLALHQMIAAGVGRAFIPTFLGRDDPRMVPVADGTPVFNVPIWVATHAELADLPRLARIRRRLADAIRAEAPWLAGETPFPRQAPGISG